MSNKTIYTPYFYIIQDTRNGKYYAGAKWAKDADPDNLMKENGYITSSITIKNIILISGVSAFKIRKIRKFETAEEAYDYESKFLIKVDARDNNRFYNGHNNDYILTDNTGFVAAIDKTGRTFRLPKGDPLLLSGKAYGVTKGKKPGILNGVTDSYKIDDERWNTGEIISVNAGRSNYYDHKKKKNINTDKETAKRLGLVSFSSGYVTVIDKEGNTSRVLKSDKRYLSGELTGATIGSKIYSNGISNRYFKETDIIPNGYTPGGLPLRYYTDGIINKRIKLGDEIPENFMPGFTK